MKQLKRPGDQAARGQGPGFLADLFERPTRPPPAAAGRRCCWSRSSPSRSPLGSSGEELLGRLRREARRQRAIAAGSSARRAAGDDLRQLDQRPARLPAQAAPPSARDPFRQQYADAAPGSEAGRGIAEAAAPDTSIELVLGRRRESVRHLLGALGRHTRWRRRGRRLDRGGQDQVRVV